jgi:FAD dependent oxidoreductase
MDSHNCERFVVNGMVKNEGDVQKGGFGPYPVSYRSLIPKAGECNNLFVPVCLSASHIAYGSIRMEPVFMVLAQSAAVASCIAIDKKQTVQTVNIQQLRMRLTRNPLANGSVPEILVDDNDTAHTIITGSWSKESSGGYGLSWLKTKSVDKEQQVQFIPEIKVAGKYAVYAYISSIEGASSQTQYIVRNGNEAKDVTISSHINVEGQTSGEWVSLGTYDFPKGKSASVTITTNGADGIVAADAILFVPTK